jgi:hypothetical protein
VHQGGTCGGVLHGAFQRSCAIKTRQRLLPAVRGCRHNAVSACARKGFQQSADSIAHAGHIARQNQDQVRPACAPERGKPGGD